MEAGDGRSISLLANCFGGRAPESLLVGRGFETLQTRQENFLLQN